MPDEAKPETKSFWASLFSSDDDDRSAREKEMVMSSPPPKPVLNRDDYSDNLAYAMAKRKANNEYKRLMDDREYNPEKYMVPYAHAEADPTKEHGAFTRQQQIDEALGEENLR